MSVRGSIDAHRRGTSLALSNAEEAEGVLAQVYARIVLLIRKQGDGANSQTILEVFRTHFAARMSVITTAIRKSAQQGGKTTALIAKRQKVAGAEIETEVAAVKVANERLRGKLSGRKSIPLSKRLRKWDEHHGRKLAKEIRASVQAKEGMLTRAERVLKLERNTKVEIPKYIQSIANDAKAHGGKAVKRAADSHIARLRKLALKDDAPPALTMRPATRRFMQQLKRAHPQDVDALVAEWVQGKAQYRARVIARHESVEAYRATHIEATRNHPELHGYQWALSTRHPVPDICDAHAEANPEGLGRGIYSPDALPQRHVACLCGIVAVFTRGPKYPGEGQRRDHEATMKRWPKAKQVKVLGQTRTAALNKGKRVVRKDLANFHTVRSLSGSKR